MSRSAKGFTQRAAGTGGRREDVYDKREGPGQVARAHQHVQAPVSQEV